MTEDSMSKTKHVMNWGALSGIALIVVSVLLYMLGLSNNKMASMLSWVALIGGIYMGTKKYRDDVANGFISYGQSLLIGTKIAFFASILLGFYLWLFLSYVDSGMVDQVLALQEQAMIDKDMPTEDIERNMDMIKKFMTPLGMSFSSIISFTIIGFIISLITSTFVKREDKSFDGFINQ